VLLLSIKMSNCQNSKIWWICLAGLVLLSQIACSKVEVVSTTCQYQNEQGSLDWMTCPLKVAERETPLTFRQFKDDLNSRPGDQKFCCGQIDQRFCCSLEEKLRELPDFDPASVASPEEPVGVPEIEIEVVPAGGGWFDGFGFWSWLILSSMSILLFGLIIYMASCVFVEIIDMIMYVLCCCFCRGYRKRDGYEAHETGGKKKKKGKEYRPNGEPQQPQSRLVTTTPSYVRTGNYQNVQSAVPINSYGGTDQLYQNVTPPPAYQEQA